MSVVEAAFARHAEAPTGGFFSKSDRTEKLLKKQHNALIEAYERARKITEQMQADRNTKYDKYLDKKSQKRKEAYNASQRSFAFSCNRTEILLQILNEVRSELGMDAWESESPCSQDAASIQLRKENLDQLRQRVLDEMEPEQAVMGIPLEQSK